MLLVIIGLHLLMCTDTYVITTVYIYCVIQDYKYIYIYIFGNNKCSGSWISHATCSCSFLFKNDHLFIL